MMMTMTMMVDTERAGFVRVSTELRAPLHGGGSFVLHQSWVSHMTPCLTAAPTNRKPAGGQKHAQKTCQQALEKSQQAAVSVSPSAPWTVCWLVASWWSVETGHGSASTHGRESKCFWHRLISTCWRSSKRHKKRCYNNTVCSRL